MGNLSSKCRVELVLADRGWILEKLAKEITKQNHSDVLDVAIVDKPTGEAAITYFLPYSIQTPLPDSIVGSYFSHQEIVEPAHSNFLEKAKSADFCVCSADKYRRLLVECGAMDVTLVHLGVDLEVYKPKLKIGVVGRTYHTGRKGESIVAELLDMPEVDFMFTGEGWPRPFGEYGSHESLAKFYQDIDYLLIPSTIEGGPVPLLEALASGCPVLSGDVGCVKDFPHIPFEAGSSASLRQVLKRLVGEKLKLRESVLNKSWEEYGKRHIDLFLRLLEKTSEVSGLVEKSSDIDNALSVLYVAHGTEKISKGGPTYRMNALREEVCSRGGKSAVVSSTLPIELRGFDIVHIFNSWPLKTALAEIRNTSELGKPIVFSPIALNLSHKPYYEKAIPALLKHYSGEELEREIAVVQKLTENTNLDEPGFELSEGEENHFDTLAKTARMADGIIFLSQYEKKFFSKIGVEPSVSTVIRNGVDVSHMASARPELFRQTFSIAGDFVLCVGRIEPRKNQALIAYALRRLQLPLVLVGHIGNKEYFQLVKDCANDHLIHIDRIDDRTLLASAYHAALGVLLVSWSEGAPLVAMEAGAAGAPLILGNMGAEEEYFGEWAEYVHPCAMAEIEEKVTKWVESPEEISKRESRASYFYASFNITTHIDKTLHFYEKVLSFTLGNQPKSTPGQTSKIYIDVTHLAHSQFNGQVLTGVTSLEEEVLQAAIADGNCRFALWNSPQRRYVPITPEEIKSGEFVQKSNSKENDLTKHYRLDINLQENSEERKGNPNREVEWGSKFGVRRLSKTFGKSALQAAPRFVREPILRIVKKFRPEFQIAIEPEHELFSRRAPSVESDSCSKGVTYTNPVFSAHYLSVPCSFQPEEGSRWVIMGQPWISNDRFIEDLIRLVKDAKLRLEFTVPDVLYLTHTSSFDRRTRHMYVDRLKRMLSLSEIVYTISDDAYRSLDVYRNLQGYRCDIKRLRLGVPRFSPDRERVPNLPKNLFLVYVSSINGRKNHDFLIEVWKELYRNYLQKQKPYMRLVLAGIPQAGFEEYRDEKFIGDLKQFNIDVMTGLDDAKIAWLYENCTFTVYPSIAEGWGFPVEESLLFGKMCIASSTVPSAIETDCAAVIRLQPANFFEWYQCLKTYISDENLRKVVESHASGWQPHPWEDTVEKVVAMDCEIETNLVTAGA